MAPGTPLLAREEPLASPRLESPTSPRLPPSHRDWASLHTRSLSSSASHLPRLSSLSPSTRTSNPNSLAPSPLQKSISFSLSRLLSLPSFAQLLSNPEAFSSFEKYLVAFSSPLLPSLRLYGDFAILRQKSGEAAAAARGVRDAYLLPGAKEEVEMGQAELREAVEGLRRIMGAGTGLEGTARRALERLFEGEFESYVKHKLLAHTKMQLEKRNVQDVAGLFVLVLLFSPFQLTYTHFPAHYSGEAFVLSDPRLPDQPIVLASPAFCALTGYAKEEIVGRNCRFLQGEATNPEDVVALRTATKEHKPITQLLLNYTKDGQPFFNLLCILPLFSPDGELTYFIGGQTNITGALQASTGLVLPSCAVQSQDFAADESDVDSLSQPFSDLSLSLPPPDLSCFSPSVRRAAENPSPASLDAAGDGSSASSASHSTSTSNSRSAFPYASDAPAAPATPVFTFPSDRQRKARPLSLVSLSSPLGSPSLDGVFRFASTHSNGHGQGHKSAPSADEGREKEGGKGVVLPQGTVEKRVREFTATYERVVLFRTDGFRILYASSSFLRYLGLPGARQEEVNTSPLIDSDLLDLLRDVDANGGKKEGDGSLKARVKEVVRKGESVSVECGMRVGAEGVRGLFGKTSSSPTAKGVLHLSPLQDYGGTSVAYVAIFA
ncbi:hypothetical protein JCM8547_002061 [Rhodosporidiobolus lusitaniae]